MPKQSKIAGRITQASYSRLRDWYQCAFMAYCKYVLKLPDPGSEAMDRGNRVHKELEDYILGITRRMSAEVGVHYRKDVDKLRKIKGIAVEQQWAWNRAWEATGWFDKDVYLRVKMDVAYEEKQVAEGIDHKTGKFRPGEYDDQMFQYCVALLLQFPHVKKARVRLWFHDNGMVDQKTLDRKYLADAMKKLEAKIQPMFDDTEFKPKVNDKCKWCPFSKKKGGPCKAA